MNTPLIPASLETMRSMIPELSKSHREMNASELLELLGSMSIETKRSSFSVTRNQRTGLWRVNFSGIYGRSVLNKDLKECLYEAVELVLNNREPRDGMYYLNTPAQKRR